MPAPFAWCPRYVFGATTWNTTLPMGMQRPRFRNLGGMRITDSGVPATYVRRKDRLLEMPTRFYESELADAVALVDWCHENGMGPVTVRGDQDDAATAFTAYLVSPAPGEEWEPEWDDASSIYTLPLVWRRTTDTVIEMPRHPDVYT